MTDENVTRGLQEPKPVFSPRSNGSVFVNSVFTETLQNSIDVSHENDHMCVKYL